MIDITVANKVKVGIGKNVQKLLLDLKQILLILFHFMAVFL